PDHSPVGLDEGVFGKGIKLITHFRTELRSSGTLYETKMSSLPLAYLSASDVDTFVEFLKKLSTRRVSRKDKLKLISPATFDPNHPGADKHRAYANIVHMRHVWLDFENGDLRP